MQHDMTMERDRLNHFLLLGTINHVAFLVIIFLIYALAGFKTSGDDLGGLMMMYALSLFMPQFVFGIFTLWTAGSSLLRHKAQIGNRKRYNAFWATLVLALIVFFGF